jgi:Bacterial regulatory proteins, luxR family
MRRATLHAPALACLLASVSSCAGFAAARGRNAAAARPAERRLRRHLAGRRLYRQYSPLRRPRDVELDNDGNGLLLHFPQRLFVTHDDGASWAPIASPGIGARNLLRDSADRFFLEGPDVACNYGVAGRGNDPINCVDWKQAATYCQVQDKRLSLGPPIMHCVNFNATDVKSREEGPATLSRSIRVSPEASYAPVKCGTRAALSEQLGISPNTVKAHIHEIIARMGVSSLEEVVAPIRAVALG